jgi:hypothetical protein
MNTKHNEMWNISFFFHLSSSKVQDDGCESRASSTKKKKKGKDKERKKKGKTDMHEERKER